MQPRLFNFHAEIFNAISASHVLLYVPRMANCLPAGAASSKLQSLVAQGV